VIILWRAALGIATAVLRIVQFAGGMLALGGFLLFGSQCIGWLKTGVWIPHQLKDDIWLGWPWPQLTWIGVQRIVDWLLLDALSLPTRLMAVIMGGALGVIAALGANHLEGKQRRLMPPRPI
jgi:hypothetical protein